jgi:transposase-like protein
VITPEIRATIRRLVLREGWKIETTARRFGVHHSVVRRALRELEQPADRRPTAPSELDPFKEYLVQRLTEHPELTAVRLFLELQLRGFTGGIAQLRRYVAQVRAPRARKAYLRIETKPAEQAQVDWGSFGHWRVGSTQRPLSAFAMVMRWSRALYVDFSLARRGARSLSRIQRRRGSGHQIHPPLVLLRQDLLLPRGPAHPGVRLGHRNANTRIHATTRERPAERLLIERPRLRSLPEHAFDTDLVLPMIVSKEARVHLDTNTYSVPHGFVGRSVHLRADDTTVRILADGAVIAQHPRCWGHRQAIEDRAHIDALLERRPAGRAPRRCDRLAALSPECRIYLQEVARRRIDLESEIQKVGHDQSALQRRGNPVPQQRRGFGHCRPPRPQRLARSHHRQVTPLRPGGLLAPASIA